MVLNRDARSDGSGPEWLARPAARPLALARDSQITAWFEQAIATGNGLAGAHCIHERWLRGALPTRVESDLERIWGAAAATVPDWLPMRYVSWLATASAVAARFKPLKSGKTHVYLVLLDYRDRAGADFGVYVGMTRYPPAQRFDQHKAGIRAAGAVLKRGVELLSGPVMHLQFIARADAARIECALAAALADSGIHVEGGH